jgi:MFS family permease
LLPHTTSSSLHRHFFPQRLASRYDLLFLTNCTTFSSPSSIFPSSQERDIYLGSYIALSTMVGQMIGSAISGFLSDIYSRKRILIIALLTGAITTCLFGVASVPYEGLLFLRVFTGGCQGVIIPVLFSLIADYYKVSILQKRLRRDF